MPVPGAGSGPVDALGRAEHWDSRYAPAWLVRTAAVGGRLLVLAVLVWLLAELATSLTVLLVPVAVALLLAGVLAPAVEWGERHRVPRVLGAAAGTAVVVALLVGAGWAIGERVADQLPDLRAQLRDAAQQVSQTFGVQVPGVVTGGGGGGGSGSAAGPGVLGQLASSLGIAVDVVIGLFLCLAFVFLLLKNGPRMWQGLLALLGGRLRDDVDAAGRAAWRTLAAYVRGLTVVALFDAVAIGVGLLVLGVPLALTLALLQFVASYVPTIGAFVAGAVAVAVAWASEGLGTAAVVAVLAVAVQQIGNDVIEPYVMQRELPVDAFTVLAAVTAGGLLWGIPGALLFVPLTAASIAAARELWQRHGRRPLAGGGGP
ncbi:hypothetical protein GCM10027194_18540 [Thalassiella azotivora]